MSGRTQWAETGRGYKKNRDCLCAAATRTSGKWDKICKQVFGDEWDYANDYHSRNCPGICIDGGTPKCRHARYSSMTDADLKNKCCLYGKTGIEPVKTCSPMHNYQRTSCQSNLIDYCQQPNETGEAKIWTDPICTKACKDNANQEWCRQIKGELCRRLGQNMVKYKDCQDFCEEPANKAAYCDKNMIDYCKSTEGQGDPICACINSNFPGQQGPECFDPACKTSYMTKSQIDSSLVCPSCTSYVTGEGSGYFQNVNQTLICDQKEVKVQDIKSDNKVTTNNSKTVASTQDDKPDEATNNTVGMVFSILSSICSCLVCLMLFFLILNSARKRS